MQSAAGSICRGNCSIGTASAGLSRARCCGIRRCLPSAATLPASPSAISPRPIGRWPAARAARCIVALGMARSDQAPEPVEGAKAVAGPAPRALMIAAGSPPGRVHVVGGGLAGLAASVVLADRGHAVILYESGPQAGGRCRSFIDSELGVSIDNGNHLLLSGNQAASAYIARIGALDTFERPAE